MGELSFIPESNREHLERLSLANQSRRGYAIIGLDNIKNGLNLGTVMRAAGCYGAASVFASGPRIQKVVKMSTTDTMKAHRHLPLTIVDDLADVRPFNCVPVAVDLVEGAESLVDFVHPERAFYIFGPEDGTLGARTTDRCKHKVYIPTSACMNLAATVNVILYDRLAKRSRKFPALDVVGGE